VSAAARPAKPAPMTTTRFIVFVAAHA
jgi:hypothetical protein